MKQAHQSAVAISEAATAPATGVFYGWWIVAASFVCLMVGINPVASLTFGVFLAPLSAEFSWSRSQAAYNDDRLWFGDGDGAVAGWLAT